MKTMTKTGYAFISNDFMNEQAGASTHVKLDNSESLCLPGVRKSDCSEPMRFVRRNPHVRSERRGPAERKLKYPHSARLRNSWSSDAIKLLHLGPNPSDHVSPDKIISRDSSLSSSPHSRPQSPTTEWNVPLLKRKHSRSVQGIEDESRSRFRFSRYGFGSTALIGHKARKLWAALERRFINSFKLPSSISEGHIRQLAECSVCAKNSRKMSTAEEARKKLNCCIRDFNRHRRQQQIDKVMFTSSPNSMRTGGISSHFVDPFGRSTMTTQSPAWKSPKSQCSCTKHCTVNIRAHCAVPQKTEEFYPISRSFSWNPQERQKDIMNDMDQSTLQQCQTSESFYVMCANEKPQDLREIILERTDGGERFGMSIENVGCRIFLTKVLHDSPAHLAGLKVGDELINWDGYQLDQLSINTILEMIRSAPNCPHVVYRPRRLLSKFRKISLKKVNGRVGIRVVKRQECILVDMVLPDSAASKCGIREGDEIIKINGKNIRDWNQSTVSNFLRSLPGEELIELVIRKVHVGTPGQISFKQCAPSDGNQFLITHANDSHSCHCRPISNPTRRGNNLLLNDKHSEDLFMDRLEKNRQTISDYQEESPYSSLVRSESQRGCEKLGSYEDLIQPEFLGLNGMSLT